MMKGEWVILLWALLGTVFLVKTTPVGGLVRRVRRQPSAVQAAVALCLLVAVITGGTKPGGTNELSSSSQPAFFAPENASLIIQQSSLISGGWPYDPTDTDGDGIPDLWEKWTHGNRQVADGGIDRDDDGLTDLEEFQNQTDPRTADTDGDGFDDAFEVANGMDTLVQEDFTPVEPDEDQNGIIDLWENEPYLYGFTDRDQNGFDDYYEAYYLEPASDDNYDVRVDVYTTRSAALTWTVGALTEGVVLPATAMTSVRIRLPFKSDARIELLAAPQGDALPAGELWKARLRLSFAPRDGQTAIGTCIVSDGGDIQQKAPESVSAVVRFPGGVPMTRRSTSSGGEGLVIDILERRFEIIPHSDIYHGPDDVVGPFTITNAVNIDQSAVHWSADFGTMSPSPGGSSTLTVTSVPPDEGNIVVTAEIMLDEVFRAVDTAVVSFCPGKDLSITDYTPNFSPHMGETASYTLELPGCNHATREGWIEGELMRETTLGWQHVGWLDASQAQPGHQKRRRCLVGPQTITWDGIATENAAFADSPDVFTEGSAPFHRALPEVVSGEPVPPPYYTIFFRYREADSDTATVIDETSTTVYVPQVVKVEMADAAFEEFKRPIVHPGTYYPDLLGDPEVDGCESNILIYAGSPTTSMSQLLSTVADKCAFQYPTTVNIRFTHQQTRGQTKIVRLICAEDPREEKHGLAPLSPFPNREASGEATVYVDVVRRASSTEKYRYDNGAMHPIRMEKCEISTLFPFSEDNLAHALASTASHETGHMLGLVSKEYLGGAYGSHNNNAYVNGWIMNYGNLTPYVYVLGSHSNRVSSWRPQNIAYLEFILPKGDQ